MRMQMIILELFWTVGAHFYASGGVDRCLGDDLAGHTGEQQLQRDSEGNHTGYRRDADQSGEQCVLYRRRRAPVGP
ncbi:MAG: hypothetical protein ACI8S3_000209 [Alphaproteobacteria bacterium]|jgi:hypothetical protein